MGFLPQRNLESAIILPYRAANGRAAHWVKPGDQIIRLGNTWITDLPVEDRVDAFRDELNQHETGERIQISFWRDITEHADEPLGTRCIDVPDAINLRQCGMQFR